MLKVEICSSPQYKNVEQATVMIINLQNLKGLFKVYALLNGDMLAAEMKCRMSTKYLDDSCLMNNF